MKRHIFFVDETAQLGGGELNLLPVARRLPQYGWQPAVILPGPGPFADHLQADGVVVYFIPRPPFLSTTFETAAGRRFPNPLALLWSLLAGLVWSWRLYRFLRRQSGVVHTLSMWAHAFGGLAARAAGQPIVWHFQDIIRPDAGWGFYRWLARWAARFIPDHIICIAERVAEPFRGHARRATKTSVLWNAIEVERFAPNGTHTNTSNGDGPLHIGTVGRLTPWKGQEAALEVARILKQRAVPFRWRFAGDETLGSTNYARRLRELVDRWELADEVRFLGWVEDVPAFYSDLDVLVHLPSAPEPFGLVLAEAMAAGLPIITTVGGGAEPLVRAAGGTLVDGGDAMQVADVLVDWQQAPDTRRNVGDQMHTFACNTFSLEQYIEQLAAIYQGLICDANVR